MAEITVDYYIVTNKLNDIFLEIFQEIVIQLVKAMRNVVYCILAKKNFHYHEVTNHLSCLKQSDFRVDHLKYFD